MRQDRFENILMKAADADWIRIYDKDYKLIAAGHWFNDDIICYYDHADLVHYMITYESHYRVFDILT